MLWSSIVDVSSNNSSSPISIFSAGDRVEFYIDGELVATITENVPTEPMKVWIGAWCPTWSGEPTAGDFTMTVKSFRYTAF